MRTKRLLAEQLGQDIKNAWQSPRHTSVVITLADKSTLTIYFDRSGAAIELAAMYNGQLVGSAKKMP